MSAEITGTKELQEALVCTPEMLMDHVENMGPDDLLQIDLDRTFDEKDQRYLAQHHWFLISQDNLTIPAEFIRIISDKGSNRVLELITPIRPNTTTYMCGSTSFLFNRHCRKSGDWFTTWRIKDGDQFFVLS